MQCDDVIPSNRTWTLLALPIMKMVPMEIWAASVKGKNGYWLLFPPAQRYCGGEREGEKKRQKWWDRQTNSVSIEIKESVFRHSVHL